ncbi:hypothetical protein Geu3261_0093_021 [Komagataeibacter europaeus NBRC 3261]|uniref:Bro-N domain-containing protein n=2 Tax=Komagataeibacter europaeus TaxID=33995 RepID=A0A0D6Q0C7_KOMEU|nr:hypothetical protein Geu3261_0093_021 [Komagataeibacter europaeus NBRC 3261]
MRTVLLPGEHRTIANPIGFGQHGRPPVFINESGLYRFIMRCDKPNARPFQTWVTGTVLPTLRKEGVYVRDEEKIADASSVEDLDSLNDMIVGLMKRKTELLEARLAEKEALIQKQAPKVSAYEGLFDKEGLVRLGEACRAIKARDPAINVNAMTPDLVRMGFPAYPILERRRAPRCQTD